MAGGREIPGNLSAVRRARQRTHAVRKRAEGAFRFDAALRARPEASKTFQNPRSDLATEDSRSLNLAPPLRIERRTLKIHRHIS